MSASLLAKSPRGSRRLSLIDHLKDTDRAGRALFRAGSRWSQAYLRFFKLGEEEHERFLVHLRLAALFHDLGKANADFQAAVTTRGFKQQSLRHEHLSALLLCEPSVRRWLERNERIDVDVVVAAVLSHHLKAARDGQWHVLQPREATPTRLFFSDAQVRDALDSIAAVGQLPRFEGTLPLAPYVSDEWTPAWAALFDAADDFSRTLRRNPNRLRLSLAVKAGLIACDSVASGLWREDEPIEAWIESVAHRVALGAEDIESDILRPRQRELGDRWKGWHRFQEGAATVGRRGLLLAACGAGKTLAAWRWAAAVSLAEPVGRVIFLYPTRGTATEGFRDYVGHAPEADTALVHGTSDYELAGMMANPDEAPVSIQGKNVAVDEARARLFALGLWSKRYLSATVDQFLGFIEHSYAGLCLLPALADAAIVFDEVHSYDPRMWNALVTFLEKFDVPVLAMTATLPPTRSDELTRRCGLSAYPRPEDMVDLQDLEAKETCPRYRLKASSRIDALNAVLEAVRDGRRVLWVVNTVRRAQELARALRAALKDEREVLVYHSRFTLADRQRRHRQTIDAFRASPGGEPRAALAITTQVCEMSLDLDADVLVTEHAPISSLVQRFGRANRHLRRGPDFRALLLTYAPESHLPYEKSELEAANAFLAELAERDVSQRDLAAGLEKHALPERDASGSTTFVTGGYFAVPGSLRESDDFGERAVLDGDLDEYLTLRADGRPTDGLMITVPAKFTTPVEGRGAPRWLRTAPSAQYEPWLGFVVDEA
jgi:CRISPR-associated endonuclease/helicase Cas3